MLSSRLRFLIFAVILAGAVVTLRFTLLARSRSFKDPELPRISKVPDFKFTNASGHKVGLQDLNGQVWVAQFMFTSCAGLCPMMMSEMKSLSRKLPDGARLVSFSVDPKDGPKELAQYAKSRGADWTFLSGKGQDIKKLCREGFKLSVSKGKGNQDEILHSQNLALVDREGFIRGYYDSMEYKELRNLIRHASYLSKS